MKGQNQECPCKRLQCKRHGDCEACKKHHLEVMRYSPACERAKKKKKPQNDVK